MVIDTGVDLSHKEIKSHVREAWNFNYKDDHGHGTEISSLVLKDTCGDIELVSCKYYYPWKKDLVNDSNYCFQRALDEDIDYINYSSYGKDPNDEEEALIQELSDKGVIIVVAAGNDEVNLTKTGKCLNAYPACYSIENLYTVENIDQYGNIAAKSNYLKTKNARAEIGVNVPTLEPNGGHGHSNGSSFSAAKYTNSLLLKKCWELSK